MLCETITLMSFEEGLCSNFLFYSLFYFNLWQFEDTVAGDTITSVCLRLIEVPDSYDLLSGLIVCCDDFSRLGIELIMYKPSRVLDDAELLKKLADFLLFYLKMAPLYRRSQALDRAQYCSYTVRVGLGLQPADSMVLDDMTCRKNGVLRSLNIEWGPVLVILLDYLIRARNEPQHLLIVRGGYPLCLLC